MGVTFLCRGKIPDRRVVFGRMIRFYNVTRATESGAPLAYSEGYGFPDDVSALIYFFSYVPILMEWHTMMSQ